MFKEKTKNMVIGLSVIMMCSFMGFGSVSSVAGTWQQDDLGIWYQNDDGSYPSSTWMWIDKDGDGAYECFCFDRNGYAYTNMLTPDGYQVDVMGAWSDRGITVSRKFMGAVPEPTPIDTYENVASDGTALGKPAVNKVTSSSGSSSSSSLSSSTNSNSGMVLGGAPVSSSSSSTSDKNSNSSSTSSSDKTTPTAVNTSNPKTDSSGPSGTISSNKPTYSPVADAGTTDVKAPGMSSNKVYWLEGSTTYHKDLSCSSLNASDDFDSPDVISGSVTEATRNGVTKACSKCC